MARVKIPGLGKNSGRLGGFHLDNGDYLVEGVKCEFQYKPGKGQSEDDPNCPYQYALRANIISGPEQEEEPTSVEGRPWTSFLFIDPDHEWTELMVTRFKNACNAFGVAVRADSINEEEFVGKRAVMRIVNKPDKRTGELRSNVSEFIAVEDSEYADAKSA